MNTWAMPQTMRGFEAARLPAVMDQLGIGGKCFRRGKLSVLVSVDDYEEGAPGAGVWAHASIARPDRDPTWAELKDVRDAVFGRDACVIQVLAPAKYWLNVHEHCFHLWMRIDAETVPRVLYDQVGADGETYRARAPFPEK